jgi:hypothetical protein
MVQLHSQMVLIKEAIPSGPLIHVRNGRNKWFSPVLYRDFVKDWVLCKRLRLVKLDYSCNLTGLGEQSKTTITASIVRSCCSFWTAHHATQEHSSWRCGYITRSRWRRRQSANTNTLANLYYVLQNKRCGKVEFLLPAIHVARLIVWIICEWGVRKVKSRSLFHVSQGLYHGLTIVVACSSKWSAHMTNSSTILQPDFICWFYFNYATFFNLFIIIILFVKV